MSSHADARSGAFANPGLGQADDVYAFPVSLAQRRLWFLDQLVPGNPAYNIPVSLRIRGTLDVIALERAFDEIVARHEALRTTFAQQNGEPVQIVAPSGRARMMTADLTNLATENRPLEALELVNKEALWNFDLRQGPLIRVLLIKIAEDDHVLNLTIHHIVADGHSLQVLIREMSTLYEAFSRRVPPSLPPLPIQYADFALWQQEWLSSGRLEEQLAYWKQQLRELSPLQLPTDHHRPVVPTWQGRRVMFSLPAGLAAQLRTLSLQENATLFMTLLAAYQVLLHRYSQQDDICVGSPIANRNRREVEGLVGFFTNMIVLRGDVSGDPSFREFLQRIRKMTLDAFRYQDVPFEKLVQELRPERDVAQNPLFQVSFSLEQDFSHELKLSNLLVTTFASDVVNTHFDLEAHLLDSPRGISGAFVYSSDLFGPDTGARIVAHYQTLLEGIATRPDQRLSQLPLLTEGEYHELIHVWNQTSVTCSTERCVPQLFEQQVERNPGHLAVATSSGSLTYADLNRRANQLAHFLRRRGVQPESLVGVCVRRSAEMIVGLLAVLKAGGAYVPLDPLYPSERLRFILEDADCHLLLTESAVRESLCDPPAELICLDSDWQQVDEESAENLEPTATARNLAYVIYTSGSTGKPKGVEIEHGALLNLIYWHQRAYEITPSDRATQLAAQAFDASVWELWPYLTAGASVHIPSEEIRSSPAALVRWLSVEKITLTFLPTPLAEAVLAQEFPSDLHLRALLTGGDRLRRSPQKKLTFRLVNHYGPTENAVVATSCDVVPFQGGAPAIGRPISNVQAYVLDCYRQPVPIGTPGRLHIGGMSLARGYHRRPELTAKRFIPNPFSSEQQRLYDTGDLVRYRSDGQLEFLGRTDEQVKVRGFRIELGEIEARLAAHPDVANSVIIVREDASGHNRLIAYLVPRGKPGPTVSDLRTHLRRSLPEYMIPSAFVLLDALPLSPHGKVDTRALPAPQQFDVESCFDPPQSKLQRQIADVWSESLKLERIGIEDNFFDLGGHSLLLTHIHARLQELLTREFPIVDLFKYPTVRTLSAYLGDAEETKPTGVSDPAAPVTHGEHEPIAVVAIAGRFPGARNVDELWRNLSEGKEGIQFFANEEPITSARDIRVNEAHYVPACGALDDVELFDASFFGLSAREAEITDPQHRLFLECAHEALELAGVEAQKLTGRIGVFAGAAMSNYLLANLQKNPVSQSVSPLQMLVGNDKDFLPTRVSYKLNLKGPSVAVQTACSTSLVAVHFACQSLLERSCDVALAGGVSLRFPQRSGYFYEPEGILSPDGHCRAFDARARGTVPSSGVAVVALRRLSDAVADGSQILAIIRGSAINNDGSDKVGYTAPSVRGQTEVIAAAQLAAEVTPETITYVETHGTGTALGDPIEIAALTQAFGGKRTPKPYCAIGSLKSNLGHLDTAAGVAGLIKTVLQLQHKKLVPSLHFEQPNPNIDFASSPFYVNSELQPWDTPLGLPRRAGVSSFGIGGTNAHVILEEAPPLPESGESRNWQVITVSAKTATALVHAAENLAAYLETHEEFNLADVAYTQWTGRTWHTHRRALLCHSLPEAVEGLRGHGGRTWVATAEGADRGVVFLFPGQGAQYPGMGRDLYESEEAYRSDIDRCAELLQEKLGLDLRVVLYPPRGKEAEAAEVLQQTWLTQPALFAVEWSLARQWQRLGVRPAAMLGHSLGELVAATLAGVMDLEDALHLVAARGQLMQSMPRGAMLSIPLGEQEIRDCLPAGLDLAAVNGPQSCVVSGPQPALDDLEKQLARRGLDCRRLHTSHAFHSAMMEPILEPFRAAVRSLKLAAPKLRFISNVSGTWISPEQSTDPEYWVQHLRNTVRFADGAKELLANENYVFLEVGPGNLLGGLIRSQSSAKPIATLHHPTEHISDTDFFARAYIQLWLAGARIDASACHAGEKRRRLPLPTYPFERKKYYIDSSSDAATPEADRPQNKRDLDDWFYIPSWDRTIPLTWMTVPDERVQPSRWLVFLDELGIGRQMANRLRERGHQVVTVSAAERFTTGSSNYAIRPGQREDYLELIRRLSDSGNWPDQIVHLWSISPQHGCSGWDLQIRGFYSLLYLAQALGQEGQGREASLGVISSDAQAVLGIERLTPEKAMVCGPCSVVPLEYPNLRCRTIDLSLDSAPFDIDMLADQVLTELLQESDEPVVAHRSGQRWVRTFKSVRLVAGTAPSSLLRERGVYLITGGLGGVGLELAGYLASKVRARLVLISRSAVPERSEWPELLSRDIRSESITRIRKILELEKAGAELLIVRADVSDREQMRHAVELARNQFGQIHGVIHAAGVPAASVIARHDSESVQKVLLAKVSGTQVLFELLRDSGLDFILLCSSQRSVLGAPGQVDYCAANAFLDCFAAAHSNEGLTRVISVAWDTWAETGMAARMAVSDHRCAARNGMSNRDAIEAFHRILNQPHPLVIVSADDFSTRLKQSRELNVKAHLEQGEQNRGKHPRPELRTPYVAPRNETEGELAEIWQQLLGIEPIGVDDNFFDLGGDSVMSIQIIARSREAGLRLTPKQIFEHQTIAQLAEVAGRAAMPAVYQESTSGALPLTPIQTWFVEQGFAEPWHYNQALLLKIRQPVDAAIVKAAVEAILHHHDALRLRLSRGERGWQGQLAEKHSEVPFSCRDLRAIGSGELASALERAAGKAQTSLDLSHGPILRVELIECAERQQRLLLVVHHLAVDAVSWRILVEDLGQACRQLQANEPIRLPAKTTSWKYWAEHLTHQGEAGVFDTELEYWLEQGRKSVPKLPVDHDSPPENETESTLKILSVELSAEETRILTQELPSACSAQINDALVTALLLSVGNWTGTRQMRVDFEALGREATRDDIDLSRTVGWFTAVYPCVLEADSSAKPSSVLGALSEQLRRVPNHGLGYGVLRYLSRHRAKFERLPAAEICFLYLGYHATEATQNTIFEEATESSGLSRAQSTRLTHRLTLIAIVAGDRLRTQWLYSGNSYEDQTIRAVAEDYMSSLRNLLVEVHRQRRLTWAPEAATAFRWTPPEIDRIDAALQLSLRPETADQVESVYPLSPMQQGMLFHSLYDPDAREYFKRLVFGIEGNLQLDAFQAAWQCVIDRHPILRTAFVWEGLTEPVQAVLKTIRAPWHFEDLRAFGAEEQRLRVQHYLFEDERRGFSLSQAPLLRCSLLQTENCQFTFAWSFHHILLDGWSIARIVEEVFTSYEALLRGNRKLVERSFPYRDFIVWLKNQDASQAEKFWRDHLRGLEAPTPLGIDRGRVAIQSRRYREVRAKLSAHATARLQAFVRAERLTMSTLTSAAWALLLSRYSGMSNVLFGAVVSGRPTEVVGVESIIGLLINTLPVRVSVSADARLDSWLRDFQERQSETRSYEFPSLIDLQKWSGIPPSQPLFESALIFENYPVNSLSAEVAGLRLHDVNAEERTSLPLTLVIGAGQQLSLIVSYDTDRFEAEAIDQMLTHYCTLLESMAASSQQRLCDLSFLTLEEREKIVNVWNATSAAFPADRCIHHLFELQASISPDSPAVVFGEQSLTYAELDHKANRLALVLRSRGVRPDTPVGIYIDRSLEMAVGLLAILKAGGAYVPLDPAYPADRISFMIEDSGMALLLTQRELQAALPGNVHALCIDGDWDLPSREKEDAASNVSAENLAYLIYTSGSTGRPKGVKIPHRAVVNFLTAMRSKPGFNASDVLLSVTTLSFDIAALEMFLPLIVGGRTVIASREATLDGAQLVELVKSSKATVMQATPATWRMLIEAGWNGDSRLKILCGGEALTRGLADQLLARSGSVWNMYGPTETTIWSAVQQIVDEQGPISIGRPIANTLIYILDQQLNPVPVGVAGELHIGGTGLALGYWNRPELTEQKFIPDPFTAITGARLYKTGDLARYRPDGSIEYLGRLDQQVKIRGFRIELGEIESVLRECPGIQECVVVVREDTPGDRRLVAYYIAPDYPKPHVSQFRVYLQQKLPPHMIPSIFVSLDTLPLTPNGKVDRRSLPIPDSSRPDLSTTYRSPADELERNIAALWQQVLGVEEIGTEDNFFDLGGHSLLMVQMHSALRKSFAVDISMMDLFRYPTVKQLADFLKNGAGRSSGPHTAHDRAAMRLEAMHRRTPFRDLHGETGEFSVSQPTIVEEQLPS